MPFNTSTLLFNWYVYHHYHNKPLKLVLNMVSSVDSHMANDNIIPNVSSTAEYSGSNGDIKLSSAADSTNSTTICNGSISKITEKPSNRYKHIFPVHDHARTSCLSRDSKAPLSFVGFKHLMVLMLRMFAAELACIPSLRLAWYCGNSCF